MHIRDGTHVFTKDEQDLGDILRVVVDPQTKVVTHIVVREGDLLTTDNIIPVEFVASTDNDRVVLHRTREELPELEPFEESYYVPLDDTEPGYPTGYIRPYFPYPPLGSVWWNDPAYLGYSVDPLLEGGKTARMKQNIPQHAVGLLIGAKVMDVEGERVGEVERVFVEDESECATHIVVSNGWLSKERKLIPTSWISKVAQDKVQLSIGKTFFDRLYSFDV